jgi:hypothetical protein
MSFSTPTLVLVARQILIYGGLLMILIGMFGSFMVIIIFSRRPLSQNPCSTYIVVNGILSFLFLPLYYLPNIVTFGFQINWLAFNTAFCKFQMSYAAFTVTSILVINCFISFDRYAMSSRSVRMRSFNSKKIARILIAIGLLLVWCLIGIPVAILFENVPGDNGTISCTSRSTTFLIFAAFFYYPILEGVLPIFLAIYFWYIMRKHVHSLNNQEFIRRFDKQITKMYLFQIIANAIASFPFAAINLYRALTTQAVQSQSQQDIVQFFRLMAIWLFYVQYCSDFYIYIITSSEIRSETVKLLRFQCRCWTNRVTVVQIHATTKKDNYNTNKNLAENNSVLYD